MPVRAKDVKGLVPNKIKSTPGRKCKCMAYGECECGCGADWTDYTTWNEAIDQMSNRSLGLNREKLLLIIKEAYSDYQHGRVSPDKSGSEHIVNEIISQEHNLLESREGK